MNLTDVCTKCGMSFKRAMLLALIKDCGVTAPNPLSCEHDFQPLKVEVEAAQKEGA